MMGDGTIIFKELCRDLERRRGEPPAAKRTVGEIGGMRVVIDDNIPAGEIHVRDGRKLLGKIVNIKP